MLDLFATLQRAQRDLATLGARFCLVGGLAIGVRARPRFTGDLDLAVAVVSDLEAEKIVLQLRGSGYRVFKLIEQEQTGRLATVRLLPPGHDEEGVVLDLLFATTGIEAEIVAASEIVELAPGLRIGVARREHLVAMKVLSRNDQHRPDDRSDLVALIGKAEPHEIAAAQQALALITQRSYHRDKDLLAELERIRKDVAVGP